LSTAHGKQQIDFTFVNAAPASPAGEGAPQVGGGGVKAARTLAY
jgi:hypothetical protein